MKTGIRLACRTRVLGECEVSFEEEATRQTPEEALLGLQPVRPLFEGLGRCGGYRYDDAGGGAV